MSEVSLNVSKMKNILWYQQVKVVKANSFVEIVLGMYQLVPEHSYYIQVSTEENSDKTKRMRRYLYQADDDCWYVSKDPGKRKGSLKNTSKSSSVPLDGWMFMTNKSLLIRDSSPKIQFGRLPQDDGFVTISFKLKSPAEKKFPRCSGDFIKGSKYYCGRPVFEKDDGMILYCSDDVKWCIGDKIGVAFIRSSEAGWSPSDEESWRLSRLLLTRPVASLTSLCL